MSLNIYTNEYHITKLLKDNKTTDEDRTNIPNYHN